MPSDNSDKKNGDKDRPAGNQNQAPRGRMTMLPEIEENLKRVYQASLTEDVPDRFTQLIAQLRQKEGRP